MMTIDREMLQMWLHGSLLDFSCGKGNVVDEVACEKAVACLDGGETVYMTEQGRILSKVTKQGNMYVEEAIVDMGTAC
jgi:hypothetical protein